MKLNRRQLKNIIETIIKESSGSAVQSALNNFNLPDDHPIGKKKDGILVLHQEVKTTVENAELFAKEAAKKLGLQQQFFTALKYFHPDPFEAKDIFFKIEVLNNENY